MKPIGLDPFGLCNSLIFNGLYKGHALNLSFIKHHLVR